MMCRSISGKSILVLMQFFPNYRITLTAHIAGDSTLVVELWLHRVADDLSGLTFQEWDPSAGTDDTSAPVTMFVNSNELCAADFNLAEVRSLQLDSVVRGGRRKKYLGAPTSPEDEAICLFAGLLANPDMPTC